MKWHATALIMLLPAAAPAHAEGVLFRTALDTVTVWSEELRPYAMEGLDLRGRPSRMPGPPDRSLDFSIASPSRVGVLVSRADRAPASWRELVTRYAQTLGGRHERRPRFVADTTDLAFEFPEGGWYLHAHVLFPNDLTGIVVVHWLAYDGPGDTRSARIPKPQRMTTAFHWERSSATEVEMDRRPWPSCPPPDSLERLGRWVGRARVDLGANRVERIQAAR